MVSDSHHENEPIAIGAGHPELELPVKSARSVTLDSKIDSKTDSTDRLHPISYPDYPSSSHSIPYHTEDESVAQKTNSIVKDRETKTSASGIPPQGSLESHFDLESKLKSLLRERIEPERFDLWFEGRTHFVWTGEELMVGVPNRHFQEWLQNTFGAIVQECGQMLLGQNIVVRFVIDPQLFRDTRRQQEQYRANQDNKQADNQIANDRTSYSLRQEIPFHSANRATRQSEQGKREIEANDPSAKMKPRSRSTNTLPMDAEFEGETKRVSKGENRGESARNRDSAMMKRRWRTLEDFVVGPCNRVAHASAKSVVEEPGQQGNPLVLYGPVGTGKTHLLEGIYSGLKRHNPGLKMMFVTAEDFMNRFVAAMHQGKQHSFRRQFRECAVLILDNLNFLAGKKATMLEFLHTLDVLLGENAQIVLSCDVHPRLEENFPPELVDRLIGGVVWSLMPPDAETRLRILRQKAVENALVIPDKILIFLAEKLRGNVRELEGAIHSIRHFARVTNRSIDLPLVQEALQDLLKHAVRVVTMPCIDAAICHTLSLPPGTLQSKSRSWAVSHPRMIAIFLCRKHTAASYGEISTYFGNKTHSTAVAAEKKVRTWIEAQSQIKAGVQEWKINDLIEKIEQALKK